MSVICNEKFNASGIDISKDSIKITKNLFRKKNFKANLKVGDMTNIPYKSNIFDCVFDVFSSCLLVKKDGEIFLKEVKRVLKKAVNSFHIFHQKKSKMFKSKYKKMFDEDTILKLKDKNQFTKLIMPQCDF